MDYFKDIPIDEADEKQIKSMLRSYGTNHPKDADELRQRYYGIADRMESFVRSMNSLNGITGEFGADLKAAKQMKKFFDKITLGKYI